MNAVGRQGQRSGASGPRHQRQYSDGCNSHLLITLLKTLITMVVEEDKVCKRWEPSTPPSRKKNCGGRGDDTNGFSPRQLDMHSFDTERISECLNYQWGPCNVQLSGLQDV
ncbi:hypothetical protein M8C21_015675 [Ambrosia artemisiifolia]|uniref:Uncharacterized protein n=1 Tax=Ambrosia artemisiifolia TaxID=4212 RepID=A0AAD5GWC8_AMBAR|nr:hypothetical protein M8C21_015675 [Ambrosia artemisiifolia]